MVDGQMPAARTTRFCRTLPARQGFPPARPPQPTAATTQIETGDLVRMTKVYYDDVYSRPPHLRRGYHDDLRSGTGRQQPNADRLHRRVVQPEHVRRQDQLYAA